MKAIVAVKRVVDYNVKVRPKSDGSAVELTNVKMSICLLYTSDAADE